MELCSLNDAFGLISEPNPGCAGNTSVTESRRHDKKKSKKCRGPPMAYLESDTSMANVGGVQTDPDRPSMKKMEPVPVLNNNTGLYEHAPVDQDWGTNEPFVGNSGGSELEKIRSIVQGANTLHKGTKPSYFGASPNETPGSAVPKAKSGKLEGFEDKASPYVDTIGSEDSMLNHDFTKNGAQWQERKRQGAPPKGNYGQSTYGLLTPELEGAEAPSLPPPETVFNWRSGGKPGGQSQFFDPMRGASQVVNQYGPEPELKDDKSKEEILKKMDSILSRLDDLQYSNHENAQKEVLLFIMTGLGVLFVMDIACRAASRL